jgi:hypothetical protein
LVAPAFQGTSLPCLPHSPLFIVTTSVLFTSSPTPFSTSGLNMWRLSYTWSVNTSLLVKFTSCMFLHHPNTLTSSPKICWHLSLWSLGPVWIFVVLPVPMWGHVRM